MLENIKSSYFIKIIFSFLNEKTKLKLLKYNKCLQNNININLINYKILSRRYILFESYGKGKEYYHGGHLIFEGEYSNGKRNGNGKEYYDYGQLRYKGEYLNGKRNGKGKEYNIFGKLIFEGGYLNGKRNGKGKELYPNGNSKFEGECLNGKKWTGKGYDRKNSIHYI